MRTIFAESLTDYGQRGTDSTYQHVPNGGDNAGLGAFARRIRQARLTGNRTLTKNSRDVWAICSEPTPEAHFATMPSELAKRCILAGTSANADPSPAIVLDPFAGSGTTGMTAWGLGRSAVLCDLSLPYLRMIAKERLGFAAWTADDGTPTMPPDEAWHQLSLIS
jgi:DNA modification methylase